MSRKREGSDFLRHFPISCRLIAAALVLALSPLRSVAQTLPTTDVETNSAGQSTTLNSTGPTDETTNPFFQSLGTNGRACVTCHEPADGFGLSTADIQARFDNSGGTDPLFAAVDGANCIDSTDHSLLLNHGLIRIILPVSPTTFTGATPQFTITKIVDPYNCQLSNANVQAQCQALFGPGFQCISVYRRPLPTTNLRFEGTIMWDGREPRPANVGLSSSLTQQASDATIIHAQAAASPTAAQLASMVAFEMGLTTAQTTDNNAGLLSDAGATESPQTLNGLNFFYGENKNRHNANFNTNVFTFFNAWTTLVGTDPVSLARESIARGQTIFNTRTFAVGAPDGQQVACAFCHNDPNVGNNSNNPAMLTRLSNDQPSNAATLATLSQDLSYLPLFTLKCNTGTNTAVTTDPGQALIDGTCPNFMKVKVPGLHGLASRAPYFRNGGAPDLATVVAFYNVRFSIGLTAQDQTDLVNFLLTL